jgi:ribosomal protein S18 acetylase RimI-like enzyme
MPRACYGHRVSVLVTKFAREFAQLAAWTGEPVEQLSADEDYHAANREHWLAWDGPDVVGALHPWRAPDGRQRLYFDKCRPDAYAPLAAAITGEGLATVDAADGVVIAALAEAGFGEGRRENEYEIPVRHVEAVWPAGITIITAGETQLQPLMELDCAIRADIPGSDGWQPDPAWFREETYDSPFFDPQTYRVALDGADYVGLARVWKALPGHRYGGLGCVGVRAPYRGRGLARALIASAFEPLAAAGVAAVTAEADTANLASHSLLTSFGAQVTGATVELRRPA